MSSDLRVVLRGQSPERRFDAQHMPEPNSGCWLWVAHRTGSNGYGRIKVGDHFMMAHRYSWQCHRGPIPEGKLVLHRCDTPLCVNPDHLFLGTHQDNSDDKVRKGRHSRGDKHSRAKVNPARGERNTQTKLTREQADAIKASAEPQRVLAARFGISQAAVWSIKHGKAWK